MSLKSEEMMSTTKPHDLYGPQVIELVMSKPGFSFLSKCYNLLYQALIPNCELTINLLREHMDVSDDTKNYILEGANRRTKCQRVLNLLIVHLDKERDFMQFCNLFNMISIISDLPHKFIAEFKSHNIWDLNTQEPCELLDKDLVTKSINVDSHQALNLCASSGITLLEIYSFKTAAVQCNIHDEASGDKAEKCSVAGRHQITCRARFGDVQSAALIQKHTSDIPPSSETVSVGNLPQIISSSTAAEQSSGIHYEQQNISAVSQPSGCVTIVSDAHTGVSFSPVTTSNDCPTTSSIDAITNNGESVSTVTTTVDVTSPTAMTEEQEVPYVLTTNNDFTELRAQYHTILRSMPDDYEMTIGILQNYISDDQICAVLCSSNSTAANKIILNSLVERLSCRENLLDFCDQLESITASHDLRDVINKIRSGVLQSIQFPVSTAVTAGTQSLISTDQQHDLMTPSVNSPLFQMILSQISLDPNSKVLAVIKKYYTRLCRCLPQDYKKTISKVKQLLRLPDHSMSNLSNFPSVDLINEAIIGSIITTLQSESAGLEFCDIMESLVDSASSRMDIEMLRNEILEALSATAESTTQSATMGTGNIAQQLAGLSSGTSSVHHTTNTPSVETPTTSSNSSEGMPHLQQGGTGATISRSRLQDQMMYEDTRLHKGFRYQNPPPLPSTHVSRETLLDEIATMLLQAPIEPNKYQTTITITGPGGFGKTSIVTSLCYHPPVKKQFTDGFLFIELGAQASDPSVKLCRLYHLLTGERLQQGDISHATSEIHKLISNYYHNLLIIIDDVWYVEDAEPLVRAFSNCKIILTTRINDIEKYLPCMQSLTIGPMTQSEAVSLLTNGVIDSSQLSGDDMRLLDELAQDVHLWPLLLSLIRGQLSHYVKRYHSSYNEAIQKVQDKLHHKGLTAFDINSLGSINRSRKLAVKACIETTLELLSKSLTDRIKALILYTGIGNKLQVVLLRHLWNVSVQESEDTTDKLWACGLVQMTITPGDTMKSCIEVHAVISQYFVESMGHFEVLTLSATGLVGLHTGSAVVKGMLHIFQQSLGISDVPSLPAIEYLRYRLNEMENVVLPDFLQIISGHIIYDPYYVMGTLEEMKNSLTSSFTSYNLLSSSCDNIDSLKSECKSILNDAHKLCRKLKQKVERSLHHKNYDILVQSLLEFMNEYPLCHVVQKAMSTVKMIMPHCDSKLSQLIEMRCEYLQMMLPDYHMVTALEIPRMRFHIKTYKQISHSLVSGSPSIEETYQYIISDEYLEEMDMAKTNWLIKLQEVAPRYVQNQISIF